MQHYYVYMLKCHDASYYVGHSDDIEKRLYEHQNALIKTCYTATRRPLQLVYVQDCYSRYEALAYERQIKNWSRSKKEALISQNFQLISTLSKKKF